MATLRVDAKTIQAQIASFTAPPPERTLAAIVLAALILGAALLSALPAPSQPVLPVSDWLSTGLAVSAQFLRGLTRLMSGGLTPLVGWSCALLLAVPWPSVIILAGAAGFAAGGRRLAASCAIATAYIVVTGYWDKAAVSLSLIVISVPLSAALGLGLGILAFRSRFVWSVLEPLLDLMQTVPTLAYLLPLITLFGIGPLVGVVASALYATPPLARAVLLGLRRVPQEVVEAGSMAGSTRGQLLRWVLLPAATPTTLVGLNQSIMAALSMVVIASMVAGVSDIGIEVFQDMKQAEFGESLLSGLVIVLLAIMLDRIGAALVARGNGERRRPPQSERTFLLVALALVLLLFPAAFLVPQLKDFPREWVLRPAEAIDAGLDAATLWLFPVTSALKTGAIYYLLLPLKIGFPQSVRPAVWGFSISPVVCVVYVGLFGTTCLGLIRFRRPRATVSIAALGVLYWFGFLGIPWPILAGALAWLSYRLGGWRLATISVLGTALILVTGGWARTMVSLELTAVGVAVAFGLGSAMGCWAALDGRVSRVFRPICDTLQTMPIFVFLVPAVMVFLVGEFTALVAIVLYAIAPAIRFTELGIRSVPDTVVEAARMAGATRWQILWHVEIPMALPEIALGLNQTIMMALSMVVIASLVGAPGLGQDVMIALGNGDAGGGLVSGLSIAILAIVCDRILKAWSARRRAALGTLAAA
jgi:glycine betaine/proline transport system permease protein